MTSWNKAQKTLNDIDLVEKKCNEKAASLQRELDGFLAEFGAYGKFFPNVNPAADSLNDAVKKFSAAKQNVDLCFINRAKECNDIKHKIKNDAAPLANDFEKANTQVEKFLG